MLPQNHSSITVFKDESDGIVRIYIHVAENPDDICMNESHGATLHSSDLSGHCRGVALFTDTPIFL